MNKLAKKKAQPIQKSKICAKVAIGTPNKQTTGEPIPPSSSILPESVFEKVLKELEGKNRQELLEWLNELFRIKFPNRTGTEEEQCTRNLSDREFRKYIADLQAKMTIDPDRENKKRIAQNKNQYSGRQRGRALKSFP